MSRLGMDDLDLLDSLKAKVGEQTGEKITILYASETGNTAELAKNVQHWVELLTQTNTIGFGCV